MWRPRVSLNKYFVAFYLSATIFAAWNYGFSTWWLAAYAVHFVIFGFGIGFGIHRTIIHRSVNAFDWARRLAALVGGLANQGSAITWGSSHYLHHAYPDTEKDPHAPGAFGWKILLGFYNTENIMKEYRRIFPAIKHIAKDKSMVFLHNYYYLFQIGFFALGYLIAGLPGLLFLGIIPSGLSFFGIIMTNYFNHGNHGYRNFENKDESNNLWWLLPLTLGENWHNNHHKYPASATNRVKWWEFDPSYLFCLLLSRDTYFKAKPTAVTKTEEEPITQKAV
jgi:fatty-acid desaturase